MTPVSIIAVGLAGFGSAGRGIHAPLLQEAGMTIAAVSTADPQRVEQVRREVPGARVVADLDALLEVAGLDLIVLATPSGLHARQARQCIGAGIAVVVDKPLATEATQAWGVVDAARGAGVALTIFQNRRFDAEHVAARDTVASGRLVRYFVTSSVGNVGVLHPRTGGVRMPRLLPVAVFCSICTATWSTRRWTCSARSTRSMPRSQPAPPPPRMMRSWPAGIHRAWCPT